MLLDSWLIQYCPHVLSHSSSFIGAAPQLLRQKLSASLESILDKRDGEDLGLYMVYNIESLYI